VISQINQELETLREQLKKPVRDQALHTTIKRKIERNEWLMKELNSHRETDPDQKRGKVSLDKPDVVMRDESE
jgi:hypothetical protein